MKITHPPKIRIRELRGRLNGDPLDIGQLQRLPSAKRETVMFENNLVVRYRQETVRTECFGRGPSYNLDSASPAVRFLERDATPRLYL